MGVPSSMAPSWMGGYGLTDGWIDNWIDGWMIERYDDTRVTRNRRRAALRKVPRREVLEDDHEHG